MRKQEYSQTVGSFLVDFAKFRSKKLVLVSAGQDFQRKMSHEKTMQIDL